MLELIRRFPDPETLLSLEPHELGLQLLEIFKERQIPPPGLISRHNSTLEAGSIEDQSRGIKGYPVKYRKEIQLAVSEAFSWLESSGLLVVEPGGTWLVMSRRARSIESAADYARVSVSALLPRTLLHARLREKVWATFVRGELDVAVFLSMKEVEVRVREAANYKETDHGVAMARNAFHKDNGPLRDPNQNDAEREALMHLFAGAIGSYKNPHSHRNVPLDDPAEAVEIILLANHLLRIVDARGEKQQT
jgi:uncharacterized protein (TIGR02391 family)